MRLRRVESPRADETCQKILAKPADAMQGSTRIGGKTYSDLFDTMFPSRTREHRGCRIDAASGTAP
jgi:hypothetical protein